jgi:hypothetical protein
MFIQADAVLLLIDQHDTIFKLTFFCPFFPLQNAGFIFRLSSNHTTIGWWWEKIFFLYLPLLTFLYLLLTFICFTSFFFFFPVNGHNFEIDEGWKKNSIQKHHKDLIFFYVCWYDESAYLRMICNSPLFWCWWVKLCIIIEKCTK